MTHIDATVHSNKTISGGTVSHIGEVYFDQDLVDAVEKTPPYANNLLPRTKNADDFNMMQGSGGGADPVVEYVLLGKDLNDGIFAWNNLGINPKNKRTVMVAADCKAEGCKSSLSGFMDALGALGSIFGGLIGGFVSPPSSGQPGGAPKPTLAPSGTTP